jgi:hypothetical protein
MVQIKNSLYKFRIAYGSEKQEKKTETTEGKAPVFKELRIKSCIRQPDSN